MMKTEIGVCSYKSRKPEDCWQTTRSEKEARKKSPTVFRGSVALLAPCVQVPNLQNYEIIHFCDFKPRLCGTWLWQPEETNKIGEAE